MNIVRASGMDLSDADLDRMRTAYGISSVSPLGGFENALFRADGARILRVTHASRRTVGHIEAECRFMAHLAAHGVPVVAPLRSRDGTFATALRTDAGDDVIGMCMTEAPGRRRPREEWSVADVVTYGALLGSMHAAAAGHEEPDPHVRRPGWRDPVFEVGIDAVAGDHPELARRKNEIMAAAVADPAGAEDLLIHQDMHLGNLFLTDEGRITVFDFDDSAYSTATHDVAIVLFSWAMRTGEDVEETMRSFVSAFLTGYERHARLPDDWPSAADLFLSLRELDIYWLIETEPIDPASASEQRFIHGRLERILDGVPFLGRPLADVLA